MLSAQASDTWGMPMHSRSSWKALAAVLVLASCRAPFVPEGDPGLEPPPPPSSPSGPLLPLRIGAAGSDFARAVATDAAGDAFVASYFSNTVDFDADSGNTSKIASGPYDIAVAKYASDGTFQWVYSIGGTDADVPYNIKVGADGYIYLTGYVTAGAICNGHVLPNGGGHDILLMRLTPAGTCDWAISVGGSGDDEGHDLALDANGDILVTGVFADTVDFDPTGGSAVLISRGGSDGFVARYGSDGSFKNVVQFGGLNDDAGNAIALRSDGDIIVGGTFSTLATFGSSLSPVSLTSSGGYDYFIGHLAPTLGLEWVVRGGGAGNDIVTTGGILVNDAGNIYVAGTFTGTASVGTLSQFLASHGDADVFVTSYDPSGNWNNLQFSFGGSGTDGVSAFAMDDAGNFYLGGTFQDAVDFDPGSGTHVVNALGSDGAGDAYVVSLSPAGDMRWIDPLSAVISGSSNYSITGGIALTSAGDLWAVGRFFGSMDFDPGTSAVQRISVGDADEFIVKYDQTTGAIVR